MPHERIGNSFAYVDRIQARSRGTFSPVERAVEFYEAATDDYEHWSRGYNMHLGFYRRGVGFFDRETMLEQMNFEVTDRLRLDHMNSPLLIDLGCGTAAISRTAARNHPSAAIKAVTVSPAQVKIAKRLNHAEALGDRIEVLACDYRSLPFADRRADGVWAVESACYATGPSKKDLVKEMARVLRKGGRFAVADCFLKKPSVDLSFPINKCYSSVCKSWALEGLPVLDRFVDALDEHGFRDIEVEDISWSVAPSLVHAPFAVLGFVLKRILEGRPLKQHSLNNLQASLLAPVLGMNRSKFSYCLVSGTRA